MPRDLSSPSTGRCGRFRATRMARRLLMHALPVPRVSRGSAKPKARLTRRPVPLAARQLRDFNPGPTAPP